jgi:maleylpyruvate isomerase
LAELLAHVRSSSAEVERVIAAMPEGAWDRQSRAVGGALRSARDVVYSRWREVEIHHVDLGLACTPADWPDGFVARLGPEVLAGLSGRTDQRQLLAWGIGRAPAPELGPWG